MIICAINRKYKEKIGKDHPDRWGYNNSFANVTLPDLSAFAGEIQQGHAYCAQHMHVHNEYVVKDESGNDVTRRTAFRCSQNFMGTNLLSADFDEEDEKVSSFGALLQRPLVAECGGLLYSTISSRPGKPRTRLIFETERVYTDKEEYQRDCRAIIWYLGCKDQSVHDPCRAFAGSKDCEVKLIGRTLPSHIVDNIASRYRASYLASIRERAAVQVDMPPFEQADLEEALSFIDSSKTSLEYHDWLRVIAGIHSWSPGPDGLELAIRWSNGRNEREIADSFRSFDRRGGGSRTTVGTIVMMARGKGWKGRLKFYNGEDETTHLMNGMLR